MRNLWGDDPRRRWGKADGAAFCAVVLLHLYLFAVVAEARRPLSMSDQAGERASGTVGVRLERLKVFAPPKSAPQRPPQRNEPEPKPPPLQSVATRPVEVIPALRLKLASPIAPDEAPLLIPAVFSPPALPSTGTSPPTESTASAAAQPGGGKHCDILGSLQSFFQNDRIVRAGIAIIPARARSVANAVMIWDGVWADPASLGGAPALEPIQKGLLDIVLASPPDCQAEIVRGPRLIVVGDQRDSTVLAFGSGEWRWADLVQDKQPPQLAQRTFQ